MTDKKDKKKIIIFIKNYYEKNGKTPNMKVISSECGVNSRVFYELFKSQREAFRFAGVPYSDVARKKVERANVARKMSRNKSIIEVMSEKETIYVVDKNRLNNYYSSTVNDPFSEIRIQLANIFNRILQSNSQDEFYIRAAYDAAKWLYLNLNMI
jgi:sensor histidine kinase YesM